MKSAGEAPRKQAYFETNFLFLFTLHPKIFHFERLILSLEEQSLLPPPQIYRSK